MPNLNRMVSQTRKKKINILHKAVEPGPYQCHPRIGKKRPKNGCLPFSLLQKAANQLQLNTNGKNIRGALENALQVTDKNEWSFLQKLPFSPEEKAEYAKQYLRPQKPQKWNTDPDMWLDSLDITNVLQQYEESHPDFEFMGPYPIDFAAPDPYKKDNTCLIDEICSLRVQESIQNGTKYIGIVYNLDPHFKNGSHWVATFTDIPKHRCYYFDSYGMYPPKQIATFMKWLTTQDPKMKLMYNGRRFQHQDSECGVYCTYFIIRMLMGDNFREFTRQSPPDKAMLALRNWLFST
jgi:hypothetical protein